jgi:tetratricopeptide (TPR) repeat protein
MEELLPGVPTLGLYEAALLFLLLVEKRYRNWRPGIGGPADARGRALRAMAAHLGAAWQLSRRLREQTDDAQTDGSPVLIGSEDLAPPIETALVSVWLELGRSTADPLDHLDELGRLGDTLVLRYCQGLVERAKSDADTLYRVGCALEERGQTARALEAYGKVVALDPSFRDASTRLAVLRPEPAALAPAPAAAVVRPAAAPVVVKPTAREIVAVEERRTSPSSQVLGRMAVSTTPAPAPAPRDPTPEEKTLRTSVRDVAAALDRLSHFEVLGVAESASAGEINAAVLRISRRYHPDKFSTPQLRPVAPHAQRIMARVSEAASVLSDPKQRALYVAARAAASEPSSTSRMDAEFYFRKGVTALANGSHAQAIDAFTKALEKKPDDADYKIYLTWTRFDDPKAAKDAMAKETLAQIEAFLAQHEKFGRGHLWVGLIHKFMNHPERAERAFKAAIERDKNLMEAERELRLLRMRRERR